jgi:HEAT repeat protein
MKEAQALEFEVQGASGRHVPPAATQDEELKLLALNGLLQTDPERALPMLEKMINGQQPPRLKRRALFVLSQTRSPRSREILTSIAKGSSNPELQLEALQYLQMFGGAEDRKLLSEVYSVSKDRDVKARILESYMASGDFDRLLQLAHSEAEAPLRLQAIRMLGVMNSPKSGEALTGLYWVDGQSKEVRSEIVDALFIQANAKALAGIARKETDPAVRKRIVERLGMMKSKDATDYLMELIDK